MFRFIYICFVGAILHATIAQAELVPSGDWPADGTRTALEIDHQLFRNCGRILERWDLQTDPPLLLDSLVLDSAPIDLLDWEGLLLVQREDGVLEACDPAAGWDSPLWTLELSPCTNKLLRHGRWLLPVAPLMPLYNLEDPRQPVLARWMLGEEGGEMWGFGGTDACFIGDTLVGDYLDCCEGCWDIIMGSGWLLLPPDSLEGPTHELPPETWPWWPDWDYGGITLGSGGGLGLVRDYNVLNCFQPGDWNLRQSVMLPSGPGPHRLVATDNLVAASNDTSLTILSLNPELPSPLEIRSTLPLASTRQLRMDTGRLLAAATEACHWVELADPSAPVLERSLPGWGAVHDQAWAGDHLLVRQHDLLVLEPGATEARLIGRLPLGAGDEVAAAAGLALVDVPQGVLVVDLSDPALPRAAALFAATAPQLLTVFDQVGAFVDGDYLVVLDLRDPDQPQERARLMTGALNDLDGLDGLLAASTSNAIELFRATPDAVQPAAFFWQAHQQMALIEGVLALGEPYHGEDGFGGLRLHAWNLADPDQPQPVGLRDFQNVAGDHARLFGGRSRLGILMHVDSPIWIPYPTEGVGLYDFIELQGWVSTGGWSFPAGDCTGVTLARDPQGDGLISWHEGGRGLHLLRDDSTVELPEAETVQPRGLTLASVPNPFNPRTILDLNLAQAGPARLAVYDLLGREVAVLLDGPQVAGAQRIVFDGGTLASGLYLARLETAGATRVIKLALVR